MLETGSCPTIKCQELCLLALPIFLSWHTCKFASQLNSFFIVLDWLLEHTFKVVGFPWNLPLIKNNFRIFCYKGSTRPWKWGVGKGQDRDQTYIHLDPLKLMSWRGVIWVQTLGPKQLCILLPHKCLSIFFSPFKMSLWVKFTENSMALACLLYQLIAF